jgi:polyhydroxybutyrate depolymerase
MRGLALALAVFAGPVAAACDADGHCEIDSGTYHIAVPDGVDAPPMVLWLHGFGGSGEAALRNRAGVQRYLDRGYAFAAVDGLERAPDDGRRSWSFHPERVQRRDEPAFFADVIADAAGVYGVDPDRVILAGFSVGGSMVHYAACARPDLFDAYAPVAGAFWRPHPVDCAGPVRMFHTHGWADRTVPLEGRSLGGGTIEQGDAWYSIMLWREENGCATHLPDQITIEDDIWRRDWTGCAEGSLRFELHPGGHGIPHGWAMRMLDWYEAL